MYHVVLLAAAFACSLAAQCPSGQVYRLDLSGQSYPIDHFVSATLAGAQTGRLMAETEKLQAETEAIRAQADRLRRQRQGLRIAEVVSDPVAWARFEAIMVKRLPDFNEYRVEVARLTTQFEQGTPR
jgi:hypothetical protein